MSAAQKDWDMVHQVGNTLAGKGAFYGGVAIQELRSPTIAQAVNLDLQQHKSTGQGIG